MNKPETREELWVMAVEKWLHHINDNYVENLLIAALACNNMGIPGAIKWLNDNSYGYIGNFAHGRPNEVGVDVGTKLESPDFMKVYWSGWDEEHWQFNIRINEILEWLRNGKRHIPDPRLFQLSSLPEENKISPQKFTD